MMGTKIFLGCFYFVQFAFNQCCIPLSLLSRVKRAICGCGAYCALLRECGRGQAARGKTKGFVCDSNFRSTVTGITEKYYYLQELFLSHHRDRSPYPFFFPRDIFILLLKTYVSPSPGLPLQGDLYNHLYCSFFCHNFNFLKICVVRNLMTVSVTSITLTEIITPKQNKE